MDVRIRDLPFDPTTLRGLSEKLLRSHHRNNYGGAVRRLNAIRAQLGELSFATTPGFQLNGLKREELVATNSMLLHELYFASLGSDATPMEPAMALALAANFGSVERWRDEFVAMGKALGGGSGWVLLTFMPREGTLVNQWAADHAHALVGGVPVLALDMYEHSYHLDYGAAAEAYVDAFVANVDWRKGYERYQAAVEQGSETFGVFPDEVGGATLLDVRRAGVFAQADALIEGARWRDPQEVGTWAAELQEVRDVVVYCVYGHEVGRATAMRLRAAGVDARSCAAASKAGRPTGVRCSRKDGDDEMDHPIAPEDRPQRQGRRCPLRPLLTAEPHGRTRYVHRRAGTASPDPISATSTLAVSGTPGKGRESNHLRRGIGASGDLAGRRRRPAPSTNSATMVSNSPASRIRGTVSQRIRAPR